MVASDQPTSSARELVVLGEVGDQPRGPLAERRAVLAERTKGTGTEAAARRPGVEVLRRERPARGAASTTTWQLVPPMPNELTPAILGAASRPRLAGGLDPQAQLVERDRGVGLARS